MINFILRECTHLRYYMPLIEEANSRGIRSKFWIGEKGKYNCAVKNLDHVSKLAEENGIELGDVKDLNQEDGIVFMVEGNGLEFCSEDSRKIVLTYMKDFTVHYEKYIDYVDHVIFPSKFMADLYGKHSEKNLYLGSPKYDVQLIRNRIMAKYDLPLDPKVLVIYPQKYLLNQDILKMNYEVFNELGYKTMVKTRGKNPAKKSLRGDFYFEDTSWYPHTTMELIHVADFVLNFDSTTSKECLMMGKPMINYPLKKKAVTMDFLYDVDAFVQLSSDISREDFKKEVRRMRDTHWSKLIGCFQEARDKYMFQPSGQVSAKILDEVL